MTTFLKEIFEAVDLSGADLKGANFSHAMLNQIDFSGTKIVGTLFEGANLVGVKLDTESFPVAKSKVTSLRFLTRILSLEPLNL